MISSISPENTGMFHISIYIYIYMLPSPSFLLQVEPTLMGRSASSSDVKTSRRRADFQHGDRIFGDNQGDLPMENDSYENSGYPITYGKW